MLYAIPFIAFARRTTDVLDPLVDPRLRAGYAAHSPYAAPRGVAAFCALALPRYALSRFTAP